MSAPNFNSDQLGFPLYVREDYYSKVCEECGTWNDAEAEFCEGCGEDLHNVEARYDELDNEFYYNEVSDAMKEVNEDLEFFHVSVTSGYYTGTQFDVDWKNIRGWGAAGDPNDLDNDDAHFYFDCCRSEMLRKYDRERRKLGKRLEELAEYHGFKKIRCVGVFSNGEAVYERVTNPEKKKYGYKAKAAVGMAVSTNA